MWRNIIMICGLLLLVGGMYHAYGGLKHSVPERMTVAEFATDDRSPGAVLLTDARLNLLKAVVVTKGKEGEIKKLYVPVESIEFPQEGKVDLLLDTSDGELLRIASELYQMNKEEQMKHVVYHRDTLLQDIALSGIMLDKASMRASRLREISAMVPNLADDFFVLRHHAKVNLLRSLVISVLGLFILVFGLFRDEGVDPSPETDSASA
ncbi:MAG: hypothetical protein D3925_08520 [Candidatus Electrothrix sp. AR5]|nr:hypothetical protein [Candidatus Electrothrix sp. AR5]